MDANKIICDVAKDLESYVYDVDAREIESTSIQDVIDIARTIERAHEERYALCNLRRVEFLLAEFHRLGGIGPVKLALEIDDEDDVALEAILDGYARLSPKLCLLERVDAIPQLNKNHLQEVVAYSFSDVPDYHRRIHQILRGGWQMLFDTSLKQLGPVFECVFKRLDRNRSHVNQACAHPSSVFEAVNIAGNANANLNDQIYKIDRATFVPIEDFSAARDFREQVLEDLRTRQKPREDHQLAEYLKWLDLQDVDRDQANSFTRRRDARKERLSKWILSHPKTRSWSDPDSKKVFLWLKGKPGSKETTLAPYLIVNVKLPDGALMLYYLFSQENEPSSYDVLNVVLSVLAAQIIRKKRHLVPYVFETYVEVAEQPALRLPCLLKQLLSCLPTTSIMVDCLDECSSEAQTRLYKKFEWISSGRLNSCSAGPEVKIMISSQNGRSMPSKLQKQASISLSENVRLT